MYGGRVSTVTVGTPFPHIAMHIKQTECIGAVGVCRLGLVRICGACIAAAGEWEIPPVIGLRVVQTGSGAACRGGAPAAGIFPLGFGG